MTRHCEADLPWYARLLTEMLRGADAEYVSGDLEESFRATRSQGFAARMRWVRDAGVTVLRWWSPPALLRRMRRGTGGAGVPGLGGDVAQAVRTLIRRPGFALLVVGTLALGIGATTTIYTVVDAVVIRALPYDRPDALVTLGTTGHEGPSAGGLQELAGVSGPDVLAWRERARTLSDIEVVEPRMNLLTGEGGEPVILPMPDVTPGFLSLLGARIQIGRSFLPDDIRTDDGAATILSWDEWRNHAAGDPSILGEEAPGVPGTRVVGVLAPGFVPPEAIFGRQKVNHFRVLDLRSPRYAHAGDRRLIAIARRRTGATLDTVRAELTSVQADIARETPDGYTQPDGSVIGAGANDLLEATVGGTSRTVVLFFASSVLLLLIAAFNAAHLLLARGLDREQEMAVRLALGASRWRIARAMMAESVILSFAGGALGALIAWGGVAAFLKLVPPTMPRLGEIALNGRVLAACGSGSLVLGVATGLVPALRQGAYDPVTASRSGTSTTARAGVRLRMTLVAAQLALAAVLAVGASLLFRSFVNIVADDPGFDPQQLVTFSVITKRPGPQPVTAAATWDEVLADVAAVPGVTAAAASNVPFEPSGWMPAIQLRDDPPTLRRTGTAGYVVTPDYPEVLRIPRLAGRAFTRADGASSRQVALVNEAFVRRFLGGGAAVGTTIRVWSEHFGPETASLTEREIVGVLANTTQARSEDGDLPAVYVPYAQIDWPLMNVVVRSERAVGSLAPELQAAVRRFNPIVPPPAIEAFTDRTRVARTEPRFRTTLFLGFASISIVLAAIGLYGTLAHAVGRRTHELGIRIAVGADRTRLFAMVVRQGMGVFAIGLAAGLVGAGFLTRFLRGFLFGVGTLDPLTFAGTAALLGLVALTAILRPARRATTVDPVRCLRADV